MAKNEKVTTTPGNKTLGTGSRPEKFGPDSADGTGNKVSGTDYGKRSPADVTKSVKVPDESALMAEGFPNKRGSMVSKSVLSVDDVPVSGTPRPKKA